MELQQHDEPPVSAELSPGRSVRVIEDGCTPSEAIKRKLIEVFSVRFCNEFWFDRVHLICGFALLKSLGSQCNPVLFKRKSQDLPIVNEVGYVKLNGPMHGVEVKNEVAIHAYLWTLFVPLFNFGYANTLWRAGIEETDQIICKKVKSEFGALEVSFAVFNDGMEAHIKVALVNWNASNGIEAFGTVEAGNSNMPGLKARSKLFDRSIKEAIHVKPGNDVTSVPLSRSVTAVPRGATLLVNVKIWRLETSSRFQQPIFKKLYFDATLTGTETKVACGDCGSVEVTVTWSG